MLERVTIARDNIIPITGECIEEVKEPVIGLNTSQLYDEGVDADGNHLTKYRNPTYAHIKNSMNPGPGFGRPDLYLTGEFQQNMNLRVEGDVFEIDSSDVKSAELKDKYGEKIFGLTQESKQEAWPIVRQPLVEKVAEIMQCNVG